MASTPDLTTNTRLPTLIQLCQRVAGIHADSITTLGDMRLDLVKPILEKCSVDQLLRLEAASPHLQSGTPEIWKELCFSKYRIIAEEQFSNEEVPEEPDSWKRRFFALEEAEARRFEEIGSRIRSQRLEAEERKREREVKFTDRLPPPKRARTGGWGVSAQPKSLFQKARGEASKIQKAYYHTRILPPMPVGKGHRVLAKPDDNILPPVPSSSTPSRVSVSTVTVHRRIRPPPSVASSSSSSTSAMSDAVKPNASSLSSSRTTTPGISPQKSSIPNGKLGLPPLVHPDSAPPKPCNANAKVLLRSSPPRCATGAPSPVPRPPPPAARSPAPPKKKDPLASLFVPKHRAYSQLQQRTVR